MSKGLHMESFMYENSYLNNLVPLFNQGKNMRSIAINTVRKNINKKDKQLAFINSIYYENVDKIKLLLYSGNFNPNFLEYITPLMLASQLGCTEIVKVLLTFNNDVNFQCNYLKGSSETALMWASIGNYTDIMKILLEAGAKIDLKNHEGNNALILATRSGSAEAVKILIDAGADINIKNNEGNTAYWIAYTREMYDIIDLFM